MVPQQDLNLCSYFAKSRQNFKKAITCEKRTSFTHMFIPGPQKHYKWSEQACTLLFVLDKE